MLTKQIVHMLSSYSYKPVYRFSPNLIKPFFTEQVRYAGHSKWQNIKHTKAAKDLQKNQLYNRHIEEIKLAVRDSKNLNPKSNTKLDKAIENARKEGVAQATISGVLAKLEKALKNPKSILYEFRGPQGLLVIISVNTDNRGRTTSEINHLTKKCNFVRATNILSAFVYKGYVYAKPSSDVSNAEDKAFEDAIEIGAEEVKRDENNPDLFVFACDGDELNIVRSKLETRNYTIDEAEVVYEPNSVIEISAEDQEKYFSLFEKLDEIPEVNGIFSNAV